MRLGSYEGLFDLLRAPPGPRARTQPQRASKGGRRGGRGRGSELSEAKREIRAVIGGVLSGKIERGVGAVLFQGYNTLLKAVEVERKIREQEELEGRVEELEELLEAKPKGGGRSRGSYA